MSTTLPNAILGQSDLTERQLESLVSYIEIVKGRMSFKEAATKGSSRPVTIGSYYGTVQQGRKRVKKSIVTVLVAIEIGLVKGEDIRKLLELSGQSGLELPEEEQRKFTALLQTLLERIVM